MNFYANHGDVHGKYIKYMTKRRRDSSVVQRWATVSLIRVSSPGRGWEFFSSSERSDRSGSTQLPIQWVPGALFLGVKQ
jgi:hypothetical protein